MTREDFGFWIALGDMLCWAICFWWMHSISSNQNQLLAKLHDQTKRIEEFSKAEHDLIKEVHPQVGEIKSSVEEVAVTVKQAIDTGHLQ